MVALLQLTQILLVLVTVGVLLHTVSIVSSLKAIELSKIGSSSSVSFVRSSSASPIDDGMEIVKRDEVSSAQLAAASAAFSSLSQVDWPDATKAGGIYGFIHKSQNRPRCDTARYLIWQSHAPETDTRGIGAWATAFTTQLAFAIRDDRILIIDERQPWTLAMSPECDGNQSPSCYFLPLTNCSVLRDVPNWEEATSYEMERNDGLLPAEARNAQLLYTTKSWARMVPRTEAYGLGAVPRLSHEIAALAYFLRLKPWIKTRIETTLRRSLPRDFNPQRSIGLPVRGSDKCRGHALKGSAQGETNCITLASRWQWVMNFVRFDPHIDTLVVTSEDPEIIAEAKREAPRRLRLVLNVDDVLQGTGSATALESYRMNLTRADAIISALTSFHLQLRTRYLILTSTSSWNICIGWLSRDARFSRALDTYVIDIQGRGTNQAATMMSQMCESGRPAGNGWPLQFSSLASHHTPIARADFPFNFSQDTSS